MTAPIGIFKGVILDTERLDTTLPFYEAMFGPAKFIDGTRWAALGSPSAGALGLAAESEITGHGLVLSVKVEDVNVAAERILEMGGRLLGEPVRGAHEIRVIAEDPSGTPIAVYQGL